MVSLWQPPQISQVPMTLAFESHPDGKWGICAKFHFSGACLWLGKFLFYIFHNFLRFCIENCVKYKIKICQVKDMHQNNEILHIFLFPHLCDAQMPNSEINAVFQGAAIGPHAILGCLRVPWFNTGVNGENIDYLTNQTIFDRFLVHGPRVHTTLHQDWPTQDFHRASWSTFLTMDLTENNMCQTHSLYGRLSILEATFGACMLHDSATCRKKSFKTLLI